MVHPYYPLSRIWDGRRKIKGSVALRAKRYLRKNGDAFELWADRPEKGGFCAAVCTRDAVTACNVGRYNSRAAGVYALLGWRTQSVSAAFSKNRNYKHVVRCAGTGGKNVPFVDRFGILSSGAPVGLISPMVRVTSAATEKKLRARIKEWTKVFVTMADLLGEELKRGPVVEASTLPGIDADVDSGVALSLLEWSRRRTLRTYWAYGQGYIETPNFKKNLISKCLVELREKWRDDSSDSTWVPAV